MAGVVAISASASAAEPGGVELLPRGELFEPLIADPGWPRFSAEHQWRDGDPFDAVAQVSFGETVAFARGSIESIAAGSRWEVGLQAQVDAIFDTTSRSFDLANEDYFVALVASVQTSGFTTQLRLSHLSAHVGDEYLIETGGGRESVAYEAIDVLVDHMLFEHVRVYGGVGAFIDPQPSFDPMFFEFGAEWKARTGLAGDRIRPIAGVDLQIQQEQDWVPDLAVLLGLRLASPEDDTRHIDAFLRLYRGRSPEGQFFDQTVELVGLGLRLGF